MEIGQIVHVSRDVEVLQVGVGDTIGCQSTAGCSCIAIAIAVPAGCSGSRGRQGCIVGSGRGGVGHNGRS